MRMTWRSATLAAVAALAVSAVPGTAQTATAIDGTAQAKAAELQQQAAQIAQTSKDWSRAASLYRRAAELQGDDPAAAKNFRMAGVLAYYSGNERESTRDLTRAGETALEWGDVAMAARWFLDAAWVAHRDGNGSRAVELAHRAERLTRSPLLLREERAALLSRIADGPESPAIF